MRGLFGWDLPPGVRVSDIPGNRPEDEAWENIYDNFWDKERLTKSHIGVRITEQEYDLMEKLYNPKATDKRMIKASEIIDNYIMAAIEYGMEISSNQEKRDYEENKHYESQYHQEVRNPKLRTYFKKQRQYIKKLSNILTSIKLKGF